MMKKTEKEIAVLALAQGKTAVYLFYVGKSKEDIFSERIYVPVLSEGEPESILGAPEVGGIWLSLVGVGNNANIELLFSNLAAKMQEEIRFWGFYETVVQVALAGVGAEVDKIARRLKEENYDAELGISSYIFESGEITFYRLRSDGHFHKTKLPFVILGGRASLDEEKSLRHALKEKLEKIYFNAQKEKSLPPLREVYREIRQILASDPEKSWPKIKKGIFLSFD